VAAEVVARAIVLDGVDGPDDRAAAGAVWDAFLGDLRSVGWLIAASGAVVSAAATSLIRPVEVEEPLRGAWRTVATEPRSTLLRAARGTVLVLAGLLVILEPTAALRMAVVLSGVYVLFRGMAALLRLLPRWRAGSEAAPRDTACDPGRGRARDQRRGRRLHRAGRVHGDRGGGRHLQWPCPAVRPAAGPGCTCGDAQLDAARRPPGSALELPAKPRHERRAPVPCQPLDQHRSGCQAEQRAVVNGYEPLLRRARVCQDLRGQRPTLLAVDFYEEGDIFDVVDTLNGVRHLP
jgi:hypothetical protein